MLENKIPAAACPVAPDGECMCVLWGGESRKTQVEVSEISLCNISAWEIAVTPSFPRGKAVWTSAGGLAGSASN